jgi:predicted ester cyclase
MRMKLEEPWLREFARRYTGAWCSRNASSVAAFFALKGVLSVNGAPAAGRGAITEVAQGFMTAFPDMELRMDGVAIRGDRAVYRWTFTGTHTGPGGTGHKVRFSGYEEWKFGEDGLIAESQGHFDAEEYQRQVDRGADAEQ